MYSHADRPGLLGAFETGHVTNEIGHTCYVVLKCDVGQILNLGFAGVNVR